MCFVTRKALAFGLGGDVGDLKFMSTAIVNPFKNLVMLGSGCQLRERSAHLRQTLTTKRVDREFRLLLQSWLVFRERW